MLLCDGSRDHTRIWNEFFMWYVKLQRWEGCIGVSRLTQHKLQAYVKSSLGYSPWLSHLHQLVTSSKAPDEPRPCCEKAPGEVNLPKGLQKKSRSTQSASFLLCLCSSGSMQKPYNISPWLCSLDPVSAALSSISFFYIRLLGSPLGLICQ